MAAHRKLAALLIAVVLAATLVYAIRGLHIRPGIYVEGEIYVNGRRVSRTSVLSKLAVLTLESGERLDTLRITVSAKWRVRLAGHPYHADIQYVAWLIPYIRTRWGGEQPTVVAEGVPWGAIAWGTAKGMQRSLLSWIARVKDWFIRKLGAEPKTDLVVFTYSSGTSAVGYIPMIWAISQVKETKDFLDMLGLFYRGFAVAATAYMDGRRTPIPDSEGYGAFAPAGLMDRATERLRVMISKLVGKGGAWSPAAVYDGATLLSVDMTYYGYELQVLLNHTKIAPLIGHGALQKEGEEYEVVLHKGDEVEIEWWLFVVFRYWDVTGERTPWYYFAVPIGKIRIVVAEGYWVTVYVESEGDVIGYPPTREPTT